MCGIAGFSGDFDALLLDRMSASIAHRGPDGSGCFHDRDSNIGLAHRRLAIIDLSATGHQPMMDAAKQAVIVYNGELYNYRVLREHLIARGVSFRGHSDTEVLLNLYLSKGIDMLGDLNGIFAFAIFDFRSRELFIARDGMGVKPLYFTNTPQGMVFASEIKALLQEPSVSRELNPAAIARHLTYLWSPAPDTILKQVHKLPAGSAMLVQNGQVLRQWQYYEPPCGPKIKGRSLQDTCAQLRENLDRAVHRQMVSDVPVGAFLSGGLDSSAVVAFAQKHTDQRLQCFTIALEGKAAMAKEGMTDDLPYAQKVAHHLDVDLHTISVGSEMIESLKDMLYYLDEPQADPAPLNALFISRLARKNGIKVLLSGAGGDDIFTGYRRHYALALETYWAWLPKTIRTGVGSFAKNLSSSRPLSRRLRKAFEYAGLDGNERLLSYFYWLSPDRAHALLSDNLRDKLRTEDITNPLVDALHPLSSTVTKQDKILHLEQKFFLADHNLNYTDRMSMAHGVEVRVPFLDPDLINFASGLPDNFRQKGRYGKWVFKKAMEGILPDEVIYRPKTGFGAPLRHWLHGELRPMVEGMLNKKSLQERGIFDAYAVENLIQQDREGKIDATYAIFAILCIELWCQIFLDEQFPHL
ncbi:MAG: asparagine synthase (glutamine-hydrolyzing) [Robiginitomaculum sp.]|nr:MAG: asparagine synthase (glutamine-hydrolyzing) [Robiginitomaculum sp.]